MLKDITMAEFEKGLKKTKTLVIPYGTVEAHGQHLPLDTDTRIIEEALKLASGRMNAFIAPAVSYGVCTSTGLHPGTIGITAETLRRLTRDIVRDAYKKRLRNFMLVSGHGGGLHVSAMKEAAEELIDELKGIRIAAFSIYDVIGKELSALSETRNDSHAGEMETSAVLYLSPELVKGRSKEEYPNLPKPFIVRDKLKYWPGAVWGNPQKATQEKGKKLIVLMADKMVELARQFEKTG